MAGDMTRQKATGKRQKSRIGLPQGSFFFLPFACCLLPVAFEAAFAAEPLPDPTRPPAALGMEAAEVAPSGPVLQSILISPSRKSAIIDGKMVGLGDRYGAARVVRITETEVVLKTGAATETLRLFPDVEKRQARAPKPGKASGGKLEGGGTK